MPHKVPALVVCCGLRRRVFSAKQKYDLKTIIPLNSAIATNVCQAMFLILSTSILISVNLVLNKSSFSFSSNFLTISSKVKFK